MELNQKAIYRLTNVQDHEGNSRVSSRKLYQDRVGCLATNLRWDGQSIRMEFVQDPAGNWIRRRLHTSKVLDITQTEEGLTIRTLNSVYLFELAEENALNQQPDQFPDGVFDDGYRGELVELYLSEEGNHFCKGIYWDKEAAGHPLNYIMHIGMVVDTCLLFAEDGDGRFFGRYYLGNSDEIEFYDTLYGQQDYSIPMVIHNCGTVPLKIRVEWRSGEWRVESGSKILLQPGDLKKETI